MDGINSHRYRFFFGSSCLVDFVMAMKSNMAGGVAGCRVGFFSARFQCNNTIYCFVLVLFGNWTSL